MHVTTKGKLIKLAELGLSSAKDMEGHDTGFGILKKRAYVEDIAQEDLRALQGLSNLVDDLRDTGLPWYDHTPDDLEALSRCLDRFLSGLSQAYRGQNNGR